jgi:carboxymethylenebutenolidase
MTYLLAARERIDAAVPFHGGETEKYLQEADRVSAPMQMHLGDQDEFIPSEAQAQIKRAFAGKPNVTIYTYPGCKHAFSRYSGTHYDAEAANLANQRTWKFFGEHLR